MITQSFIQALLDRVDIVDIISRHLPLKKKGANFVACCPFHDEKTPSFTVNQPKQFYHCFGCGKHGNAIDFLKEYSGLSFIDAIETIAADAGLSLPSQEIKPATKSRTNYSTANETGAIANSSSLSENLHEYMEKAARYYCAQLKQSGQAIAYLQKRGITGQTAKQFAIGYAPDDWQNLATIFTDYPSGNPRHALVETGLVISQEKKSYDRFRNRIMFPILNHKRKIIGFGGRVLDNSEPKYLNSPETPLFTKGRELYNLPSANLAARKAGCILVVEGYLDVIMLAQSGIEYAVATLGTATTSLHIQKLLRHTDEVIFCFDGDKAGLKAAWRALETSLPQLKDGKNIKFLFLPDGEDPDSYIRQHGQSKFENLLEQATPLSLFLCNELSRQINLGTDEGRTRLIQRAGPLLSQITAPVFAFMITQRLAELARIDQNQLTGFLKSDKKKNIPRQSPGVTRPLSATPCRRLIQILLHHPAYVQKLDSTLLLATSSSKNEEMALLTILADFLNDRKIMESSTLDKAEIVSHFDQTPYHAILRDIARDTPIMEADWDIEAEFIGGLTKLREIQRKLRMTELHAKPFNLLTLEEKQELQRLAISSQEH
ncbi:MAG: DNA primase [Nitrosomonas sp.]|nr:DNA primase [Nitrosomonas sp.]